MTDYFEVVERKKRPEVICDVRMNEDGTAVVSTVGTSRSLTYELVFPSLERHDAYMASDRAYHNAKRFGGRLTIITPNDLLGFSIPGDEQGEIQGLRLSALARVLGIPETVLKVFAKRAWLEVIQWHQQAR